MLNEIMNAVTRRLDELFGDGYTIYTDGVEQGLKEPCFFVQFLEPSEKPMIGRRYFKQTDMCIQYMPGDIPQIARELNRVSDTSYQTSLWMEWSTLPCQIAACCAGPDEATDQRVGFCPSSSVITCLW